MVVTHCQCQLRVGQGRTKGSTTTVFKEEKYLKHLLDDHYSQVQGSMCNVAASSLQHCQYSHRPQSIHRPQINSKKGDTSLPTKNLSEQSVL